MSFQAVVSGQLILGRNELSQNCEFLEGELTFGKTLNFRETIYLSEGLSTVDNPKGPKGAEI